MTNTSTSPLTLVIFGASGSTGKSAVAAARARGHRVRAVDHHVPDDTSDDEGITHVQGDVLKDDLRPHVRDADAVLSCLGVGNDPATLLDPPPLYSKGTEAICDAMEAEGIKRLITISATFVETRDRGPIWFKLPAMTGLHLVFEQMKEMEANLRARPALDWTAVRPGWLMEGKVTGDYTVQPDVIPDDMVRTRHADLADFIVRLAETRDWVHATPAIARPEAAEHTSPRAVAEEIF
ncbi:NAD(P)-dependent oxidoreductase [Marimonas sp. MJW-29]|uniref:NAD(P)-dependent oxidoreductase n=1 Tax=Sulfitobacter sediminis TaxID=3234186 RepID=A0ABV3RTZ6_9RHOB